MIFSTKVSVNRVQQPTAILVAAVLIFAGLTAVPFSGQANPNNVLVGDVSSICAATSTEPSILATWDHSQSEALARNPAVGDSAFGSGSPYTATGVSVAATNGAATISSLPSSKSISHYLSLPIDTSSGARIALTGISVDLGSVRTALIGVSGELFLLESPIQTKIESFSISDISVATDALTQEIETPVALLESSKTYFLRLYLWSEDVSVTTLDYKSISVNYKKCLSDKPTVTAVTPGLTSAEVSVTAPSLTGGSTISAYEYSLDSGANWSLSDSDPATNAFSVTGLTQGTTYSLQVRAVTVAGSGLASDTQSFSTNSPPSPIPGPLQQIPGTGFESGTLDGWTSASGGVVSVAGPEIEINSGPNNFVYNSSGSKSAQLIPQGNVSFDSAVSSNLGLSDSEVTALRGAFSGIPTNAAWIYRTVTLQAGVNYRMAWNYTSTDYEPFNDGSVTTLVPLSGSPNVFVNNSLQRWALLGFTNLGTGVYSTGSYGSTGWQISTYQVSETGDYKLGFAAFNIGDTALPPVFILDDGIGSVTKNGELFLSVAPNDPNAPTLAAISPPSQNVSGAPGTAITPTSVLTPSGLSGEIVFTSDTLPPGLTLNPTNGVISGTPTSPFAGSVTITATGSGSAFANSTINFSFKGNQSPLVVTGASVVSGNPVTLSTTGGSGTGAVTFTVSNGTATGCSLSGAVLTASSAGTCLVTATKASDDTFNSTTSASTVITFMGLATAPTITAVTPAPGGLSISFDAPDSDGDSPITNYKYSLDNGLTFTAFSPAQTTSPLTISGLSPGVTYVVQILAVNEAGDGEPSLSEAGVPTSIPTPPAPVVPLITPPVLTPTLPTPAPTPTGPGGSILMPTLPPTPGVVFGTSNPIPAAIVEILNAPLAYVIALLTGLPELPRMAPSESIAHENGAPVEIQLVKTDSENGYVLRGDGWEVALEATDSSGEALKLDDSGNIILNDDRFVQFSGTGFAPGSLVKVWLFSDPTELSDVIADADGTFTGKSQIPAGIPTGEHTIQLNGLTQDGQLRSVSLGVLIQPDPVGAAATPPPVGADISGLMGILWTMAAGVLAGFFFFILWRRRKKKEEDEETSPIDAGDVGDLIFASEGFEASPTQQFPDDSRRKIGSAAPPNRKRFTFKPRNV